MRAYVISATKRVVHDWGEIQFDTQRRRDWRKAACGQVMADDMLDSNTFGLPRCKNCSKKLPDLGGDQQ